MNKVMLIGNLTKAPDLRYTGNGTAVCSFNLAVNRRYKGKDGSTVTDFFPVVAWGKLGELCGQYLDKGSNAGIVGELQTRSYEAKDGTRRYVTEVVAESVDFLTRRDNLPSAGAGDDACHADDGITDISDEDLPF